MTDDLDFNVLDGADEEQGDGPKALRDAHKALKKQYEQQAKQLSELLKKERERTVSESLTTKGVDPRVARFIPEDADVDAWLAENGDLFGVSAKADEDAGASEAGVEAAEGNVVQADFARQSSTVDSSAARTDVSPVIRQMQEAAERGDLNAIARLANSGT